MGKIAIDYVEFASGDIKASMAFFSKAMGWSFEDYGPHYHALKDAGLDGGIDGSGEVAAGTSLVVLKTDELELAVQAVLEAGGEIIKPIFSFPGGRRFHFREPGGNELAIWSE